MAISGRPATYTGGGKSVTINPETAVWLGRMLVGESGTGIGGKAVLWTTMQRYFDSKGFTGSYLDFIRAFSQPINPLWLPGGSKFEAAKKKTGQVYKTATSDAAVARRRKIQSMDWTEIPIKIQQLVAKMMIGTLDRPAKFGGKRHNNFASYSGVEKGRPGGVWIGGNYFFSDIPNKKISINGTAVPGTAPTGGGGSVLPVVAIAAIIAIVLKKK